MWGGEPQAQQKQRAPKDHSAVSDCGDTEKLLPLEHLPQHMVESNGHLHTALRLMRGSR